jgi:uncharacterized protein YkwD
LKNSASGGVETSINIAAAPVGVHGKRLRLGLFGAALGLAILFSVLLPTQKAGARSRAQIANQAAPSVVTDYEARLATSINAVRRRHGLCRLKVVPQLMRSANGHSLQMAHRGFFSHNSANGASFFARIQRFYASRGAGENLLWAESGIRSSQVVVRWLNSPAHRAILLSRLWNVLGVGVVKDMRGPGVYGGHAVLVITADFAVRH